MICVEALPADDGDSLWVEWDAPDGMHRMLVDGGRSAAAWTTRLAQQPTDQRRFDVVLCTHIDVDHIGGLLTLFRKPPPGFTAADVWFNGWHHLHGDVLGPSQGDQLTGLLVGTKQCWNVAFGQRAIVLPEGDTLPTVPLPGLTVTVLSPNLAGLRRLREAWPQVVREAAGPEPVRPPDALGRRDAGVALAALARRPYAPDNSPANGSSIAVLLSHDDGSRVLLGADAQAEVLVSALRRLQPQGRVRIDLCKVPHHASAYNLSPSLLAALDCRDWLISTSGARYGHPDRAAIARLLARRDRPRLWFNYRSAFTEEFAQRSLAMQWGFTAVHPPVDTQGIRLEVVNGQVRPG